MLTVLLGPSCSGKTTLQQKLVQNDGYHAVRTATTRPRRMGEDSSTYYFLKDSAFGEWERRGDLICCEVFRGWRYGVPRDEISRRNDRPNRVVILTVGGALELLSRHSDIVVGDGLKILYLGADGPTVEARAYQRGDDRREYLRRMAADSIDFRKFPQKNGMWEFEPSYILSCLNNRDNYKLDPKLKRVDRKEYK